MDIWLTALEVTAAFVILAVGGHFLAQIVITYQTTPSHLKIALFGVLPVWRIPLHDTGVRRITYGDSLRSHNGYKYLWIMNRLFVRGYVLIHRRQGIFRYIVLSPANPNAFIDRLVAAGATREP